MDEDLKNKRKTKWEKLEMVFELLVFDNIDFAKILKRIFERKTTLKS